MKEQKLRAISQISSEKFRGLSRIAISKTLHPSQQKNNTLIQRIQKMGNEIGYKTFLTLSLLDRNIHDSNKINCPTLIIYGKQDIIRSREDAIELPNLIPNSDVKVIENTGHMIPFEQPQELAISILDWLKKLKHK